MFNIHKTTLPWAREAAKLAPKWQRQIWLTYNNLAIFASCEEDIPKEQIREALFIAIKTSALSQKEGSSYFVSAEDWLKLIEDLRGRL
jgi:hypothetical protein